MRPLSAFVLASLGPALAAGQENVPTITLSNPELTITAASSGFPIATFGTVFNSVIALDGGRVIVTHPQTQQILLFDSFGRHVASAGGPGDAPGETRSLASLGLIGDTVWTRDSRVPTKFNLYSSNLAFLRSDSALVAGVNVLARTGGGGVFGLIPGGGRVDPATGARYVPVVTSRLSTAPVREIARLATSPTPFSFRIDRANISIPRPFLGGMALAISPRSDFVVLVDRSTPPNASPSGYQVVALTLAGDTLWRSSIAYTPIPLDNLIAEFRTGLTAGGSAAIADSVIPTLPRFGSPVAEATVSSSGEVWIEQRTTRPTGIDVLVLDSRGAPKMRVIVPDGHRIAAAGRGVLWTVSTRRQEQMLNRFTVPGGD